MKYRRPMLCGRRARRLAVACLAVLAGVAGAGEPLRATIPDAHWESAGVRVDVGLDDGGAVGAERLPAVAHYAIGVAGLPQLLAVPQALFAWPLYMLFAAPWQGVFNARVATLAHALTDQPLPQAVVQALREQWPPRPEAPALRVVLRLHAYGLATRSGRPVEALAPGEDLCLAAQAGLEIAREGAPLRQETLRLDGNERTPDAPPPVCAPLDRWAREDGRLAREAVRELAEVLAALVLRRVEALR